MKKIKLFLSKVWRHIKYNWNSLVYSIGSIAFGINMYFYPFQIRHNEEELHLIGLMLEHWLLAFLFVLFGGIKLVGIISSNQKFRQFGLVTLSAVWAFIMIGYGIRTFQGSSNYGTLLTLMIMLMAYGMALRGRFDE